jgi:hypothetical protein
MPPVIEQGATAMGALFDMPADGDRSAWSGSWSGSWPKWASGRDETPPPTATAGQGPNHGVGLRGLEPLTSSLSGRGCRSSRPWPKATQGVSAVRNRPRACVLGKACCYPVGYPGRGHAGAVDSITSSPVRRCSVSRLVGGHRVATRSGLDAGRRRADREGSGRRLGGEWSSDP